MSGANCGRLCLHELRKCATILRSRGVLELSGKDAEKVVQNLVTRNMTSLASGETQSVYAGFLNNRGRMLFESIISRLEEGRFLIEVDRSLKEELKKHINRFKLRAKAELKDLSSGSAVWSLPGFTTSEEVLNCVDETDVAVAYPDPRSLGLGMRAILPGRASVELPEHSTRVTEKVYNVIRLLHGLAEGSERSGGDFREEELPLECNLDLTSGVSFDKGCYIGQELTARTHHTGVVRKRFVPFSVAPDVEKALDVAKIAGSFSYTKGEPLIPYGLVQYEANYQLRGMQIIADGAEKTSGELRGMAYNLSMGHVRLEHAFPELRNKTSVFKLDNGMYAVPWRPRWLRESGVLK